MGGGILMSADKEALHVARRIEHDTLASRRKFIGGAAAAAAAAAVVGKVKLAHADAPPPAKSLAASPPPGFVPFAAPGRIIKVKKSGSLMPNGLYPKEDDANGMLERVMKELTGKPDLASAIGMFVHKDDKVVVKVNGIALTNMGTNKELVVPFLEAMIKSGVPAENITVLEQYGSFLGGTRITAKNVPNGVKIHVHNNGNAAMAFRNIPGTGMQTKFVSALTDATALINFALIKDHSICGYTGALKNMTHGCTINPHDFHTHHASPQIALLANQDVIKSRLRLNIIDGYKVMAQGGLLWKSPNHVVPHEALYASTDPVALDYIGWQIVEEERAKFKLKTLAEDGRTPAYIKAAADLGLGIADKAHINLRTVTI
jgi:uncharacterized protein (DUF362 family)